MIRSSAIKAMNDVLMSREELQKHIDTFKKDEPQLHSWMINHARGVIEELGLSGAKVSPDHIMAIHNHVCLSYVFTWAIFKGNRDLLVEKIVELDQFEAFIRGMADDKMYKYSTEGLDPKSTLFKAKAAKQTYDLDRLRKILIPIVAEDISTGHADRKTLEKVDKLNG